MGCALSGLPMNDSRMAASPPRFSSSDFDLLGAIGWDQIIPHYDQYPASFKAALPCLIASVIYQSQTGWMEDMLSRSHPIFESFVFQRRHEQLGGKTLVQCFTGRILVSNFRCEDAGMEATGMPEHIRHAENVNLFREDICRLSNAASRGFNGLHDSISDLEANTNAKLKSQVGDVVSGIMNNFQVNCAVPLTQQSVEAIMANQCTQMMNEMRKLTVDHRAVSTPPPLSIEAAAYPQALARFTNGQMDMTADSQKAMT